MEPAKAEVELMECAERDSSLQEHQAAFQKFRASICDLVVLVDTSTADSDFNLAQLRIRAARGRCDATQATLEHHRAAHGC
jgi:hypothetical protein